MNPAETTHVPVKFTRAIIDRCIAVSNNKPDIVSRRFGPSGGYAIAVAISGNALRIVVSVAFNPPTDYRPQYQIIQVMDLPVSAPKQVSRKIQELVVLYECDVWTFSSEQASQIARLTEHVTVRTFEWASVVDTGPVTLENLWQWFFSAVQNDNVILSGVEDGKPGRHAKMLIHHMWADGDANNKWGVVPMVAMSLLAARAVRLVARQRQWNNIVFGTPVPPESRVSVDQFHNVIRIDLHHAPLSDGQSVKKGTTRTPGVEPVRPMPTPTPIHLLSKRELRILVALGADRPTSNALPNRFVMVVRPDAMGLNIEPLPRWGDGNYDEMDVVLLDHGLDDNEVKIVHDYLSPIGSVFMLYPKG